MIVEMEDFSIKVMCNLARTATEIRMSREQCDYIKTLDHVATYALLEMRPNSTFFMGVPITFVMHTETENRVISFVLPDTITPSEEVWLPFKMHMQLFRHDPNNGVNGDCVRAVIASLLNKENVEEVPHFGEGLDFSSSDAVPVFEQRIDAYLGTQQVKKFRTAYTCGLDDLYNFVLRDNPGVPIIVEGMSPRGRNHSVIYFNGVLAHDPHPDGGGIIGQMDNGQIHVTVLVNVPHMDQRFVG